MVVTGDIRGNGEQLKDYLKDIGENEHVQILDVDGRPYAAPEYLDQVIMGMQYHAELTKSPYPFLHVQINPEIDASKSMGDDDWLLAADVLAENIGFAGQRRVIVLHKKHERIHAHVVFERYHHASGKMIDNKFSRSRMNAARAKMEETLGQNVTPRFNTAKRDLKETITKLWHETKTGQEFIRAAKKAGFVIALGVPKRPFRVIDQNGRSYDLVRQIDGIRTKDVRARLRFDTLVPEKIAIRQIREQQESSSGKRGSQKAAHTPNFAAKATAFAENRFDAVEQQPGTDNRQQNKNMAAFAAFQESGEMLTAKEKTPPNKEQLAREFAENKTDGLDEKAANELRKKQLLEEQKRLLQEVRKRRMQPRRR